MLAGAVLRLRHLGRLGRDRVDRVGDVLNQRGLAGGLRRERGLLQGTERVDDDAAMIGLEPARFRDTDQLAGDGDIGLRSKRHGLERGSNRHMWRKELGHRQTPHVSDTPCIRAGECTNILVMSQYVYKKPALIAGFLNRCEEITLLAKA